MTEQFERDDNARLEQALSQQRDGFYELILFVAGAAPNSVRAVQNTREMCEEYLGGRHNLQIIDLYQQPGLATREQVIAAPTLIRKLPLPEKRMVGTMRWSRELLLPMHLEAQPPSH